uniref:Uncharacterized protein n=1 Tax=viral metagenome TaxID=1070528 RepID=A0A6C0H9V7_9ZZZZ
MSYFILKKEKARSEAYYALEEHKKVIKTYKKNINIYIIKKIKINNAKQKKNNIINYKTILFGEKRQIYASIMEITYIKDNILSIINIIYKTINNDEELRKLPSKYINKKLSIYHKKIKQLDVKLKQYELQLEKLDLQIKKYTNDLIKIYRIISASLNRRSTFLSTKSIYFRKQYEQTWLNLKNKDEIYNYECIKQLTVDFIINNDNKTKILFELENWKNEFSKLNNEKTKLLIELEKLL